MKTASTSMKTKTKTPIKKVLASSFGAAFLASSIAPIALAGANPFSAVSLDSGYEVVSYGSKSPKKGEEGGCGEGKSDKSEGSCGEGSCGESDKKKHSEGSCGESGKKKHSEGSCGEGKCGG